MIFLDASYVIGLYVENEQWHEQAVKIFEDVEEKGEKIISNLVIEEIVTAIGKKVDPKASKEIYNHILNNYNVINENRQIYNTALDIFVKHGATLSLTDSVSVEIMKEKNIHEIASFDKDFDRVKGIFRVH